MKERFFHLLSVMVFVAFLLLTIFYAWQDSQRVRHFVADFELPSLGMAMAASLDRTAAQYHRIGDELLRYHFLRDWMLDDEPDIHALQAFLGAIRQRFDLQDASIVHDASETYYSDSGRVVHLDRHEVARDGWYYLFRDTLRATNIDTWYYPEEDQLHIWVNLPIFDAQGQYIGLAGAGVNTDDFSATLMAYGDLEGIEVYLARTDGQLVYASNRQLLAQQQRLGAIWETDHLTHLNTLQVNGQVIRPEGSPNTLLWVRYMEEWNTWLVVEKTAAAMEQRIQASWKNSALIGGLLSLFLFLIIVFSIRQAQRYIQHNRLELEHLAGTDPLTGLSNRIRFTANTQQALQELRVTGEAAALLLLDIDHFKQVNDTWGHPVGDQVICALADILRQHTPAQCQLARFGGEEFMVFLPSTDLQRAHQQAETLRQAVAKLVLPECPAQITISLGIALIDPQHPNALDLAYQEADHALYCAKAAGRNCVISAS